MPTNLSLSRAMATLRDIQNRLKSVKNISKITQSMKMIASTKLVRAQRLREQSGLFATATHSFLDHVALQPASTTRPYRVVLAMSSDKGLCGSIHSGLARYLRASTPSVKEASVGIVSLGAKIKPQLERVLAGNHALAFWSVSRQGIDFSEVLDVCDDVLRYAAGAEIDVALVYNEFKSMLVFNTVCRPLVTSPSDVLDARDAGMYDMDKDEVENFVQYSMAVRVYDALCEGAAAEMSTRRVAMENATKNAGEIITRLTMKYNRQRQACITSELVDIITGASVL